MNDVLVCHDHVLVHNCGHVVRIGDVITLSAPNPWFGFEGEVLGLTGRRNVLLKVIAQPDKGFGRGVVKDGKVSFHMSNLTPDYSTMRVPK